jgi:tripartite-type tricarboxylate transporter receptor subunit TctC
MRIWLALISSLLTFAASPSNCAEFYPAKPVKIVVPFAPGGGNDFIARFMAQRLSTAFGQQFLVENKPGAGGLIGVEAGLKSAPDGYTLTLIPSAYTAFPSLYKLKFDPVGDIAPIIEISRYPLLIVVHPRIAVKTAADLIALAKGQPGKLNFASPGQGSTIHLAAELFASMAGIKMNHVPYKGSGPALTDTIGGQVDLYFSSIPPAMPHVKAGRLRAIAITAKERFPTAQDIPTVAESGLPGYNLVLWYGLAGPKGLPRRIVERINAELMTILKANETVERFQNDGLLPSGGTPEQFLATIEEQISFWRKVVNDLGVRVD